MKTIIAILVVIIIAFGAGVLYLNFHTAPTDTMTGTDTTATTTEPTATTTTTAEAQGATVIGKSVKGADITAYHYGSGSTEILFVGGLHGGYDWNTSLLAYNLKDYLDQHPDAIPANESVTVIPVVNPDGLAQVVSKSGEFAASDVNASADTVAARFNANNVDLDRNFDCDWQTSGVWQTKTVSGGTAAFSEPESQAIQAYIAAHPPTAVVVWFSAAGGVFASNCHSGVLPATDTLTQTYATASGYPAHESYDFYATTGDMVNWLAKQQIPAISVLLTNHTDPEWTKNLKGIQAVLAQYAQ
ncbi:MAG TPA: M14 family metallopeptidase [Candidatus Paceibacterota bacterium]|nr:M14 family metallopeptidase [Candidatus Paceibacterota bacterium]